MFLAVLISSPFPAHASILSFVGSIFNKISSEVSYQKTINSQNMAILYAVNNIDPNPAKGGGDITIVNGAALLPDEGPSGTLANIETGQSLSSDQINLYVVRRGDSLSQIAKMFGVTTNTIIWANDIKRGSLIREGQQLVILPITGIKYTMKKGDTLKSITKKYKGNLEEVLKFNGISVNSSISIGDIIVIPDGEITAPKYKRSRSIVRGTTNIPSYSGYYMRPVNGIKTQGIHGYNAVDIAAPYGTPIVASANGKVIISKSYGWNGGYGTYIVIKHANGTQTLYSHNSRNIVSSGQNVVKGQVIGYVGSTGRSTGNHTHFEIRGAKNPF